MFWCAALVFWSQSSVCVEVIVSGCVYAHGCVDDAHVDEHKRDEVLSLVMKTNSMQISQFV